MGGRGRLILVSNRLPSVEKASSEEEKREMPVGGLVSALKAALVLRDGLWFGWSGRTSDLSDPGPTRALTIGGIQLVALALGRREVNLFYNQFSNRTLWPLLHSFPAKMTIRHDGYRAFRRVNHTFAQTLLPWLSDNDLVWVHDYHMVPLGRELRNLGWNGKIGYFLHTPFPPMEVFTLLPWADELLDALLDYDLVGVQTRRYEHNLLDTLTSQIKGARIGDSFTDGERSVRVGTYPIGIDPDEIVRMAETTGHARSSTFLRRISSGHQIVLGVDRLDYTKGIVQRLRTFEYLLERYPGLRGRVSMVQISAPSRSRVPEYVQERQDINQLVGAINGRFAEAEWVPIHYLYRSFSQQDLVGFYREANVGLVTPLRDGMNLVAKEFVAAQRGDNPGVVVLSAFCGAADTMREALLINPYDVEGTAQAIYRGLGMSRRERVRRWSKLMKDISTSTASTWSNSFLADLAAT